MLIALLVFAIVVVLAFYVVGQMGLPSPIDLIVRIIVGVIALLYLLNHLAPSVHLP